MRALSFTRPWDELVLTGGKTIENRSWITHYRGPMVVHAAKSWAPEAVDYAAYVVDHLLDRDLDVPTMLDGISHHGNDHPTGYRGLVDLVDVCTAQRNTRRQVPIDATCSCGPWAMPGQAHWKVANPRLFPKPIEGRGHLNLWGPDRMPPEVFGVAGDLGAFA